MTSAASGASVLQYAPFGDLIAGDSSLTPHQFTGQWRDRASGLQHHRARWLSTDPVFDWPENSQSGFKHL